GGDLAWSFAADTGEVRRRRPPRRASVCFSEVTASGLDVVEGGRCRGGSPVYRLDETRDASPELTANGRPIGEELRHTLLVREAFARYAFGRAGFATAWAGRRRLSVADGFVHDDYVTGLGAALDLGAIGPRWSLSAAVFQPTRDLPSRLGAVTPMLAVRADFLPSLFERAGLFAALLVDRSGGGAEVLRGALAERLVTALGEVSPGTADYRQRSRDLARTLSERLDGDLTLAWLGTSGSLLPARGQRLAWTAAFSTGEIGGVTAPDVEGEPLVLAREIALRGRLASARWETDLGERASAGASLLYLSGGALPGYGDGAPVQGSYRGFLGVSPFVTETNLFFGGGLSESFASRRNTAAGVSGRGVVAPGVNLLVEPAADVTVETTATFLASAARGPFGGRRYGTELDLEVTWSPRRWLMLGAELDVLVPGDFFPGGRTMYKSILALDLLTP
ncbi:MAG TPA: hypothetical protein VFM45_13975, partial [Anaeromyxobacteraceae bacterium]|nr:hypothetical protein [Anaeromyxobacteraceae bacterium]